MTKDLVTKKGYFILMLSQIGNVGAHQVQKIDDQPKEGFSTAKEAEDELKKLLKTGKYPYDRWYSFTVSKLYYNVRKI